jgi:spore coat protein U-like protein
MNSSTILNRKTLPLAVSLLALSVSAVAIAGTDTSNLAVSASVADNCLIDANGGLDFSAYDPISANASTALDATGTVSVTCTQGAGATVTLSAGANADTGSTDAVPLRRMAGGADFLEYFLFQEDGRTTVWGNTAGTGVGHTGTGSATNLTVYGRVTEAQIDANAGNYSDTVVATVTF